MNFYDLANANTYELTIEGTTVDYGRRERRAWDAYFEAKRAKQTAELVITDKLGNVVRTVFC